MRTNGLVNQMSRVYAVAGVLASFVNTRLVRFIEIRGQPLSAILRSQSDHQSFQFGAILTTNCTAWYHKGTANRPVWCHEATTNYSMEAVMWSVQVGDRFVEFCCWKCLRMWVFGVVRKGLFFSAWRQFFRIGINDWPSMGFV